MIRVKLSTNFPEWPLIRQTPGRSGVWGECRFFVNEEMDECDFWVVYDDVLRPETVRCPPGNTLLITGEPPSVKRYHPRFAAQFARVLTCQREMKHPNVIYSQQALPWMVGCRYVTETKQWDSSYTKDYDELSALPALPKTKLLSVLSSNKRLTPGHERRLAFVQALTRHFGDDLDVFGRGLRDVEDKWEAIAPYQYHVVIENGQFPDYWTEKLSDTFLAEAYPLYAGCPNIGEYFPKDTLTELDITDFGAAIKTIQTTIDANTYFLAQEQRRAAKSLVLNEYNLFTVIETLACGSSPSGDPRQITLRPGQSFTPVSTKTMRAVKNVVRRVIKPKK